MKLSELAKLVKLEPDGSIARQGITPAIDILSQIVAFDTPSSHDADKCKSTVELANFLQEAFLELGCNSAYSDNEIYPPDSRIKQASLICSMGPNVRGGIAYVMHTDNVPASNWSSDPYVLEQRDDKLYARGSVDMKAAAVNF